MIDYWKKNTYFAQIADGLEATGAVELEELGAVNTRPVRRGIYFNADPAALYRINYCTRLCTRILAPIKSFACPDAAAIYRAAGSIDWPRFFSLDQTFAVFASTAGSTVPHSQFAGLKLKDAVADQFRNRFGRRPNVDSRTPDLWINLHVEKDRGTISVDTSGGSLHRRGYRTRSGDAPMQETVAAAMVRLSEWDGRVPLADPMCGSGTLVTRGGHGVLPYSCRLSPTAIRFPAASRLRSAGMENRQERGGRCHSKIAGSADFRQRHRCASRFGHPGQLQDDSPCRHGSTS